MPNSITRYLELAEIVNSFKQTIVFFLKMALLQKNNGMIIIISNV